MVRRKVSNHDFKFWKPMLVYIYWLGTPDPPMMCMFCPAQFKNNHLHLKFHLINCSLAVTFELIFDSS